MGGMGAIWLDLRAELQRRWRDWLIPALLAGLFAGAVTGLAVGARRTDSSYQRFLAATRAPNLLVFGQQSAGSAFASVSPARLAALPHVTETAEVMAFSVIQPADVELLAPTDRTVGQSFWTKKLIAGRLADPRRADEVTVSFALAQSDHVGVGDQLRVTVLPTSSTLGAPTTQLSFHVVGIDAAASEFPPANGTGIHAAWATPAFYRLHRHDVTGTPTTALRVANGDQGATAVLAEIFHKAQGLPIQAFLLKDQSDNTQRSIHLQAVALWILSGLLALVALLVMGQLLVRQSSLDSDRFRVLHALGMTTRQLWWVGMARSAAIGLVAAAVGTVIAVATSPLLPIGLAGVAEPHVGLWVDAPELVLGAAGTVVAVCLCGAFPTWRAARRVAPSHVDEAADRRPLRIVTALQGSGAPVPMAVGVAWGLQPRRGLGAAPTRSTIGATIVGLTALTASLVFASSLSHLVDTPALYGVSWDAEVVSSLGEGVDISGALPALEQNPNVTAIAEGYAGIPLQAGTTRFGGLAFDRVHGASLRPRVLKGRFPEKSDEILLGSRTLAALHAHIGSRVHVDVAGVHLSRPLRVVGVGVFPTLADTLGLGQGAELTTSALRASLPSDHRPPPDTILIRMRPGTAQATALQQLNRSLIQLGPFDAIRPDQPVDLVNFGRVSGLPVILGVLLSVVAAATLIHLLLVAIRRRQRDMAVLKVLGFSSRQLRGTIRWQTVSVAIVALLVGLPLGVVVGRSIWNLFAHQLGVVAVPTVPWLSLAVVVVASIALVNLIAVVPARRVVRSSTQEALRVE